MWTYHLGDLVDVVCKVPDGGTAIYRGRVVKRSSQSMHVRFTNGNTCCIRKWSVRERVTKVIEDHGHCAALSDPCSIECREMMHECNANHVDPCDVCREMARSETEK